MTKILWQNEGYSIGGRRSHSLSQSCLYLFRNSVMSPYRSMTVLCRCINSTTVEGKLNAYGKSQTNILQSAESSEEFLQGYWKYKG
jgi:hypothetical protein